MSAFNHPSRPDSNGSIEPLDLLFFELTSGEYGRSIADISLQLRSEISGDAATVMAALPDKLFEYIIERLKPHCSQQQLNLVKLAYRTASTAHSGVTREDGSPYITHPLRAAITLIDAAAIYDHEIICQALLHDVVEDSKLSQQNILELFGERVARGVAALSKDTEKSLDANLDRIADAFETGAPYVKVADRIDNLRTAVYRYKLGKRLQPIEEAERHFLAFTDEFAPELRDDLIHAVAHATYLVRHTELYHVGFRRALRTAVLELHESLGNLEILSDLDSPEVTTEQYLSYLKKVWGLLEPLETQLSQGVLADVTLDLLQTIEMKADLIRADLRALGLTDLEIDQLPRSKKLPELTSISRILGVLYTIEGSLLGGIAVRGNVEAALGLTAESGTSFLNTYGDVAATTAKFEAFMGRLEGIAAAAEDSERFEEEVVLSAVDMFVLTHGWYH